MVHTNAFHTLGEKKTSFIENKSNISMFSG